MNEHERGYDTGYSAAIHDARVPGSRAYAEINGQSRYAVCVIEHGDLDTETAGEILAETEDEAKRIAEKSAGSFDLGTCIVDRTTQTIDWGNRVTPL